MASLHCFIITIITYTMSSYNYYFIFITFNIIIIISYSTNNIFTALLWYPILKMSILLVMLVANIFKRVLESCMVVKNKSMRTIKLKIDNIWHIGRDITTLNLSLNLLLSLLLLLLLLPPPLPPYHYYYLIILFYNYFIFHTINYMHDFFFINYKIVIH